MSPLVNLIVAASSVLFGVVMAQAPAPAETGVRVWKSFSPPEAGFTILMPAEPSEATDDIDTKLNRLLDGEQGVLRGVSCGAAMTDSKHSSCSSAVMQVKCLRLKPGHGFHESSRIDWFLESVGIREIRGCV